MFTCIERKETTMIIGYKPQLNIYTFEAKDGSKLELELGWQSIRVPSRDGSETWRRTIFDLKTLVLNHKVAIGTTADEAFAALRFLQTLPETDEIECAMSILRQYLSDTRQRRTNDYLLTMVELYGRDIGTVLFTAVGKHEFVFPAFHLRNKNTADLVLKIMEKFPGVCSAYRHCSNSESLLNAAHRCGGSKFRSLIASAMGKQSKQDIIAQLDSALQAVKYLETYYNEQSADKCSDHNKLSLYI
jgi:hypothetical protein